MINKISVMLSVRDMTDDERRLLSALESNEDSMITVEDNFFYYGPGDMFYPLEGDCWLMISSVDDSHVVYPNLFSVFLR